VAYRADGRPKAACLTRSARSSTARHCHDDFFQRQRDSSPEAGALHSAPQLPERLPPAHPRQGASRHHCALINRISQPADPTEPNPSAFEHLLAATPALERLPWLLSYLQVTQLFLRSKKQYYLFTLQ